MYKPVSYDASMRALPSNDNVGIGLKLTQRMNIKKAFVTSNIYLYVNELNICIYLLYHSGKTGKSNASPPGLVLLGADGEGNFTAHQYPGSAVVTGGRLTVSRG